MKLTMADYVQLGTGIGIGAAMFYWSFSQKIAFLKQQKTLEEATKKAVEEAAEVQRKEALALAEKVKADLEKTTAVNDKKLDTIHNLVNSDMGKVLDKNAKAMDKIAILENTEQNKAAAAEAHRLLALHEAKQYKVDVKEETGFETKGSL